MFLFIWVNYLNVSLMDFVFLEPSVFKPVLAYNVLQNITYSPLKLYSSGQRVKETDILFRSKESYAIATEILKGRFDQAVTIPGTLKYHALISTRDRKLLMKKTKSIKLTFK